MKLALKIGLVVIVLVVVVAAVIGSRLDSMIKAGLETVGPRVTQTPFKLDSVSVSLLSGRGRISGLVIGNPEGFRTESALKLADTRVSLDVGTLLSDRIVIDEVLIDGPEVTYERGATGSNIDKIQKNIEAFGGSSPDRTPKDSKEKAVTHKKFQINRLSVKNGRVLVNEGLITGKTFEVSLPDIELKDIGKGTDGATVKEVSAKVLAAIEADVTRAVASAGKNLAPELEKAEGAAKEVGSQAGKAASDAEKNVRGIFKK